MIRRSVNNPYVYEQVKECLGRAVGGDEMEFTLTTKRRCNDRLARVSALKTAFLAAFAVFGYRYAFDARLQLVRQQIRNPHEQVIDGWSIAPLNLPGNTHYLLLFEAPLPGIVVKLDTVGVLLPSLNSPANFYRELAAVWSPNELVTVSGKVVAWPETPEMVLDV